MHIYIYIYQGSRPQWSRPILYNGTLHYTTLHYSMIYYIPTTYVYIYIYIWRERERVMSLCCIIVISSISSSISISIKSPTAPGYLALAQSLKGPATPRLCSLQRGKNDYVASSLAYHDFSSAPLTGSRKEMTK